MEQQLAWNLQRAHSGHIAFLVDRETVYFSVYSARESEPVSAVTELIEGVYAIDRAQARRILRSRIYATASATEMCLGMVRVAAKRITDQIVPRDSGLKIEMKMVRVASVDDPILDLDFDPHSDPMSVARKLVRGARREGPLYERDRPVGAVLTSSEGKILGLAFNSNAENRTWHAEQRLVRHYFKKHGRPLPIGAKIYTTLKPCKMCAGMIWHSAEAPETLRVFYDEFDTGPMGRWTVLDSKKIESEI